MRPKPEPRTAEATKAEALQHLDNGLDAFDAVELRIEMLSPRINLAEMLEARKAMARIRDAADLLQTILRDL